MISSSFAVAVLCCVVAIPLANAYPEGAGACPAGTNAVSSPHKSGSGSLSSGGIQLTLDSNPVTPGSAVDFAIGQDHVLTVTSSSPFTGILFRLGSAGGVDTTSALSIQNGDSSLRLASETCISGGAGGVTHTSQSSKTTSSVTLRLDSVAPGLPLDITVVGSLSSSFYSGFTLNAVAAVSNPSPPAPTTPAPTPLAATPVAPVSTAAPVPSPVQVVGTQPVGIFARPTQPNRKPRPLSPAYRPVESHPAQRPIRQRPSHSSGEGSGDGHGSGDDR